MKYVVVYYCEIAHLSFINSVGQPHWRHGIFELVQHRPLLSTLSVLECVRGSVGVHPQMLI